MVEVVKLMATSFKRLMQALLHSVPPTLQQAIPTHASARDSWTLKGKSGSVSCGVTAPFSWVLVHTRFCLCPPRVCFPVLCKFWWLSGGVNGNFLQEEEPEIKLPTSAGSSKKQEGSNKDLLLLYWLHQSL